MATCKVHDEAAKHARKLIDAGTYDDTTDWSEAAPSPDDATTEINEETFGDSPGGIWHQSRGLGRHQGSVRVSLRRFHQD